MLLGCLFTINAQSANDYFVGSANMYVNSKSQEALKVIEEGLETYPENPKLLALKQKIEEEQAQGKGDSDEDGENSEDGSQQNPDENQNQQKSDQQDGRNQGEKGAGSSDDQSRNQDQQGTRDGSPNQGEDLQRQRYDKILKALQKQEQNTQRRLIMGDNKSQLGRKQKDW